MPQVGQIIPDHLYPHNKVVINDNTVYTPEVTANSDDSNKFLFVFASPKGRDNKVITIDGGLEQFLDEFGQGPFSTYGQPYLNAYLAFSTGDIVGHCLRVSSPSAAYAASNLVALYKVDVDPETSAKTMIVKFKTRTGTELTDLDLLEENYTAPTGVIESEEDPDNGYSEVKILSVAALGKGTYGNKLSYGISNNIGSDKENDYKNYIFNIYENETYLKNIGSYPVCFNDEAIIGDTSLFADGIVNDPDTGSKKLKIVTHLDGLQTLYKVFKETNPDTTLTFDDFDPFLGINKYTKQAIVGYEVDTMSGDAIIVNATGGIELTSGNDGTFAPDTEPLFREVDLNDAYQKAWSGQIDENIASKNRFPVTMILDANYPEESKKAMIALRKRRGDCALVLDCGLNIKTKVSPLTYVSNTLESHSTSWSETIEAYCGVMRDPYSKKLVTVTSTASLALSLPKSFTMNGGHHVPFAGNTMGVLEGFVKNSIYPVYDDSIDEDVMDELADARINFAKINAKQEVVRATQTTRQIKSSKLSEMNNALITLDVKRDCERLCATYQYNFAEAGDIIRFNRDAEDILNKYSGTQLRSIAASFNVNDYEAERGILHLYVGFVHKNLVKTTIIEIDVNNS